MASLALLVCATAALGAVPISITNAGFEDPVLVEGTYPTTIPNWTQGKYDVTAPTVWISGPSVAGVFNVSTAEYTGGTAPEGNNMSYTTAAPGFDTGVNQVLSATLQADATYNLSAAVGNPFVYNGGAAGNYRIELLAGGVLLQSASGPSPADDSTFTTASLTYGSGAAPAQLGLPLEIRLLAVNFPTDEEVDFDKVQLTVTLSNPAANPGGPYSVPVGGSLSLNGSGSLPADGQTVTTWEWDLDNNGTYDVTGVTPASITYADLQATYGMIIGANTIKLRVTDDSSPTPKTSTTAGTVTLMPPTAIFTSTLVQPVINGADIGYWNPNSPSTAPGQDKWFYENSGAGQPKGQTFTITGNVSFNAVSFRLRSTKKAPENNYLVRIGTVDTATNTFYQLHSEVVNQPIYWNPDNTTDCYGTWTLATPVTLPVNPATGSTLYAFDITFVGPSNTNWQGGGIPYPLFENTNVYAGGNRYTTALGGAAGVPTNAMQMDSGRDREFHLDMDATTITDTTPPTLTTIGDNVSGGPIYADQVQVIYTLTFNERLNETTIDLADFENLGSGVSIDSVVSVAQTTPYPVPSVIKVVLGISGTGTLQLGVKTGSNIADLAGNPVTSPVADDTTITVSAANNPGAGNRWWDLATTGITDGVSQGGTSNWDTTTTNWDRGFGFAAPVAWVSGAGYSAIFGGTAGTVALDQDVTLEGLTVSLPSAAGLGYSIGDATENNTLNFTGAKTITVTATGTGTNQDATIKAGITGSPTLNIAGRATNAVNSFSLLPTSNVTMALGSLNMLNTFASNKRLILDGESTGNVADTVTWSVTGNQLMLTKAGTGSWTINNDLAFSTGGSRASRLYVEQGTLTLGGTNHFLTHKIGVATNRETTFTASNLDSKLIAKGTITIGDNREYLYVQNKGTLSPGPGVEKLTVRWNAANNATTTHAQFNMQTGSIYEWDIASSTITDVIDVQTGGSNFANLILGNMTLKIKDAGVATSIAASDKLTVFTYETDQPVTRTIGTVSFDTSALGAGWTVGTLALTDDGAGTIYLTGLSKAGGTNTFATWIAGYPGVGAMTGFTDDPDGDGNDSGLENFFGTDPSVFTAGVIAGTKTGNTFTFTHPQNATPASDVTAAYTWSTDLATFTADGAANGGTTVSFSPALNTPTAGTTTVTATVTGTAIDKLFVRVAATQN